MPFSYRNARIIGMARLDVDLAFTKVMHAIERACPGELRLSPVRIILDENDNPVGQIGSQEENIDRASSFLMGKVIGGGQPQQKTDRLLDLNDELSLMRSYLMTPQHVRGTFTSFGAYRRKYGGIPRAPEGLLTRLRHRMKPVQTPLALN